tara:strand:- start:197 stop:397 length:201 start_codon:yes stop_codon:yes gene_type:complete
MNLKKIYKTLSIFSIVLGITILLTLQNSTVGAVILKNEIKATTAALWSSFFIVAGLILYYLQAKKQ